MHQFAYIRKLKLAGSLFLRRVTMSTEIWLHKMENF